MTKLTPGDAVNALLEQMQEDAYYGRNVVTRVERGKRLAAAAIEAAKQSGQVVERGELDACEQHVNVLHKLHLENKPTPPTVTAPTTEVDVDFEKRCCYEILDRMQHAGCIAVIRKVEAMDALFKHRAAASAEGYEQGRDAGDKLLNATLTGRDLARDELRILQSKHERLIAAALELQGCWEFVHATGLDKRAVADLSALVSKLVDAMVLSSDAPAEEKT
jgi:hypothetical protein